MALNNIVIMGRLTQDPQALGEEGKGVAFSVAVERSFKREDGPSADFFKVVSFRPVTVKFVTQYLKKGDAVVVHGSMESNKYTNKEGVEMTGWQLMAADVQGTGPSGSKSKSSSSDPAEEFDPFAEE